MGILAASAREVFYLDTRHHLAKRDRRRRRPCCARSKLMARNDRTARRVYRYCWQSPSWYSFALCAQCMSTCHHPPRTDEHALGQDCGLYLTGWRIWRAKKSGRSVSSVTSAVGSRLTQIIVRFFVADDIYASSEQRTADECQLLRVLPLRRISSAVLRCETRVTICSMIASSDRP